MLSKRQRAAILELHAQNIPRRGIATTLGISRQSVRKVLRSQSSELPVLLRPEKAESYRQQVLEQFPVTEHPFVRQWARA